MNSVEFNGIAQYVAEKFHVPISVLVALVMALLVGWVCWRTRSTHVVISRIWRLVYGKTALGDREIGKFIETRNRLVMFRFFSGMPTVRTLAQAKRLIQWSSIHDEEIADIKACGDLFDLEECRLREERIPGRLYQVMKVTCAAALLVAIAFTMGGLLTERALLQFKDSKKWFLLSENTAIPLWEEGVLAKKTCMDSKKEPSAPTGFSNEERALICKAFSEADTVALIDRTVLQQRYLLAFLATYLAYFAWAFWASFRRGLFATQIKDRISKRSKSGSNKKTRRSKPVESQSERHEYPTTSAVPLEASDSIALT